MLTLLAGQPLAWAQIIADPSAPGNQRPTVLLTANGLPQVNIQTPSAAGVSRNTYRQFDVSPQGAILNNSRTSVQTQQGGWVQGNPWLAGGSARVIVNEVNSTNPSLLRGYTEVAGPRAQVIIANPAGISVDGGGFLNASRVTLTTGTPVFSGGNLDSYRVQGGTVSVDGAGLDTAGADYTAILARAVQVNAGIWANRLQVVTGSNLIDAAQPEAAATPLSGNAGNGPAPAFALDVSQLGGMYAGKITLLGTEAGVGVRNAGVIGASAGDLVLQANGWLTNSGTLQGGDVRVSSAGSLNNSGTVYARGNASVGTQGEAAHLDNSGLIGAQHDVRVSTAGAGAELRSAAGSALAAGMNADGTLAGSGDLSLGASGGLAVQGQAVAGGGLAVSAPRLDLSGSQLGAQHIDLQASAGGLDVRGAAISTPGALAASAAAELRTDGAVLSAGQLNLSAQALSNIGGSLVQTGGGAMAIGLQGALDNTGGLIASGGDAALHAQSLNNSGGQFTAAGALNGVIAGAITNQGGLVAANGALSLSASALDNTGGAVASVQDQLTIHTTGAVSNAGGYLQSRLDLGLISGALDNRQGLITGRKLSIDTAGQGLDNAGGTLASAQDLTLHSGALINNAGLLQSGGDMAVDTGGQALDNTRTAGTPGLGIASQGRMTLTTGDLDNTGGFIGAGGALTAHAGQVRNGGGVVAGESGVDITAGGFDNYGGIGAGQVQALGDVRIAVGTGVIDNTASLLRSGGTLALSGGQILNSGTDNETLGLEGQNVLLSADHIDNHAGAIRAGHDAVLTSGGSIDNGGGTVSAGHDAVLQDTGTTERTLAVRNTGGTVISGSHTRIDAASLGGDGQVLSQGDIAIDLRSDFNNTADVAASGNVRLSTTGTVTNHGKLQAGDTLAVTASALDNTATGEIAGSFATVLTTGGALTNRGLIDGGDTQLNVGVVNNLGTGRIYGDHLSIAAATVNNDPEMVDGVEHAGTIAARDRLDIGAANIHNGHGALIFSGGDLAIGRSLDANRQATGKADKLVNDFATIESLGNMRVAAAAIGNLNAGYTTQTVQTGVESVREFRPDYDTQRYTAHDFLPQGTVLPCNPTGDGIVAVGWGGTVRCGAPLVAGYLKTNPDAWGTRNYVQSFTPAAPPTAADYQRWGVKAPEAGEDSGAALTAVNVAVTLYNASVQGDYSVAGCCHYYDYDYQRTTFRTEVTDKKAGRIIAGGDMTLEGVVTNDLSDIIAGGAIKVVGPKANNIDIKGTQTVTIHGQQSYHGKSKGGSPEASGPIDYTEPDAVSEIPAGAYVYRENAGQPAQDRKLPAVPNTALANAPGGPAASAPMVRPSPIIQVNSTVGTPAPGARTTVVRTTTSAPVLPTASLYKLQAGAGSHYLVETDPRFAGYRQWLSSDYMLTQLGLDPATAQKRLGDGFYEQRVVREQVSELTGRRYLGDYRSDDEQYMALMSNGAAFGQKWQLRPGVALTPEQMSQLTTDIVWLVEEDVVLPDGSHQRVLVPRVYVRVKDGDLDGSGALISGDRVDMAIAGDARNNGTIMGRSSVKVSAVNVDNSSGRIDGNVVDVHASNDLDNYGGVIRGGKSATAIADHDLNNVSTTHIQTLLPGAAGPSSGSRTNLTAVAGIYATGDDAGDGTAHDGILKAHAGHDLNLDGSIVSSNGTARLTADHDINLAAVETGLEHSQVMDGQNYENRSSTHEVGATVQGGQGVSMWAGNDITGEGVRIDGGKGDVNMYAVHDITLTPSQDIESANTQHHRDSKGFLSSSSETAKASSSSTTNLANNITGNNVNIVAHNNLSMSGTNIASQGDAYVWADNVLDLGVAYDTSTHSYQQDNKKSGVFFSPANPVPITPGKQTSQDKGTSFSNTAQGVNITSAHGNITTHGVNHAFVKGVTFTANEGFVSATGGTLDGSAAVNTSSSSTSHSASDTNIAPVIVKPSQGAGSKTTQEDATTTTSLTRNTFQGANVTVKAIQGDAHLAGTTINTPGTLTLSAPEGKFYLDGQQIETTTSHQSTQSDALYQKASGEGGTEQHTEYNQFNAGKIVYDTPEVRVQLGSKDSAAQLATQPGMAWVGQLANDPAVASRVKWDTLEDASSHWQYKQQGLTPAGAAVVTAVVAYFTAGMGNGIAVGMGMTTTVGGTTLTAAGTVVAGMTGAAITTLATQVAIAIAAHPDDLGAVLDELGSSANVKSLVGAILTGGVLGAMNMNPDGLPTAAGGAQTFTTQLLENLKVGMARAVIDTAIQGGSLEERLKGNLYNAFVDTLAAQGAYAIGDGKKNGTLNDFTQKIAHAIAGCAAGALRQEANCSAGAIGAMVGEMAAEWYGNRPDTVQFSSMMASMAAAVAGEDAVGIALAGQAGANAAANNAGGHPGWGYEYPDVDHPFAPTAEFKALFFGSPEERQVWYRTQEIAAGTATAREWMRFDEPSAQLPRSGGPLYEIFDLGLEKAGPVRIAYSPKFPNVFYVSLDHYNPTSAQPLRWTRFEARPSK